jgi:hypothetical protein
MTAGQTRTVEVFFSYDHEDEVLLGGLENHLRVLVRQGLISAWHSHAIQPGQEWEHEISRHLHTAHIILLLISPAFMASDRCYKTEMMQAMQRHEAGEARVIPIILRPVDWEDAPFSKLQVLPTSGKPVRSWPDIDEAFTDIARGIRRVVKELLIAHYLTRAEQLYKENLDEEALDAYDQASLLGFNAASAYCRRGNILLRCKKYEEALIAYEDALRIDRDIADMYFYQSRGDALQYLKRYEEALAAYEQAIRLGAPHPDPRLYYNKGLVLEHLAQQAYALAQQYSQGVSHGTVPNSG